MNMLTWGPVLAFCIMGATASAGLKNGSRREAFPHRFPTPDNVRFVGFKAQENPSGEAVLPKKHPRVVAYCLLPGARDRFVITSEAQLVQITQAGVATVIGVVIAPTSSDYLCMIKTEKTLIGVNSSGHLVNIENGAVVGAVVPIEEKEAAKEPDSTPAAP